MLVQAFVAEAAEEAFVVLLVGRTRTESGSLIPVHSA
jgi:hypothetical protein